MQVIRHSKVLGDILSVSDAETCPACGASMQGESDMSSAGVSASSSGFDASQVTINVEAVEVEVLDPGPDSPRSQG